MRSGIATPWAHSGPPFLASNVQGICIFFDSRAAAGTRVFVIKTSSPQEISSARPQTCPDRRAHVHGIWRPACFAALEPVIGLQNVHGQQSLLKAIECKLRTLSQTPQSCCQFSALPRVLQCLVLQFVDPVEHIACRAVSCGLFAVATDRMSWATHFTLHGAAPRSGASLSRTFQRSLFSELRLRVETLVVMPHAHGWEELSERLAPTLQALHLQSSRSQFCYVDQAGFPGVTQLSADLGVVPHLLKFQTLTSLCIQTRFGSSELPALTDIARRAPRLLHLDLAVYVFLVSDPTSLAPLAKLTKLQTVRLTLDFGHLQDPADECVAALLIRSVSPLVSALVLCGELSCDHFGADHAKGPQQVAVAALFDAVTECANLTALSVPVSGAFSWSNLVKLCQRRPSLQCLALCSASCVMEFGAALVATVRVFGARCFTTNFRPRIFVRGVEVAAWITSAFGVSGPDAVTNAVLKNGCLDIIRSGEQSTEQLGSIAVPVAAVRIWPDRSVLVPFQLASLCDP